jgi:folate-dependent phosphoribosylglycinamide formyltransferase PurN
MLNVHPSLLPAFGGPGMYGRRVHAAVLAAGARVSGATVHFVDEAYDRGAIAAQWPVPVFADDTPESLAARVLRVEHALLPPTVAAVGAGRLALGADGRARGAFAVAPATESREFAREAAFLIQDDAPLLRAQIDDALGDGF